MAPKTQKTRVKQTAKSPLDQEQAVKDQQEEKGYSGTGDYQFGKLTSSDPSQATDEQIKENRAKQRGY